MNITLTNGTFEDYEIVTRELRRWFTVRGELDRINEEDHDRHRYLVLDVPETIKVREAGQ